MKKVLIFGFVAICLLFLTSTASASWWNVNWKYRREITITNVNGTLTDYQILVKLNTTNFNFSHAQENGSDIRFIASDDETPLSHWIEVWNSTNQSAKIWVNVSEITEGTKIFMYYGNENASDASDVNATFIRVIDGVVGAWHFDEGEGNITHDTSGEGNDGTLYDGNTTNDDGNTPPQWTDGKFGKALSFDGVDDYVEVPDSASLDTDKVTITLWLKRKNNDTSIIFKAGGSLGSGTGSGYRLILDEDNKIRFNLRHGSSEDWVTSNSVIPADVFTFIAVTFDGSVAKIYINGELDKTGYPSPYWTNDVPLRIGHKEWDPNYFNGIIDEVRVYSGALSEKEIKTLYYYGIQSLRHAPYLLR